MSLIVTVFPSAVCKSKQMSFTLSTRILHSLENHATDCPGLHMEFLHGSYAVEELLHQILNPPQCHVHLKLLALKEDSSLTRTPENQTENAVGLIVEIRVQVKINLVDIWTKTLKITKKRRLKLNFSETSTSYKSNLKSLATVFTKCSMSSNFGNVCI